MHWSRSIRFSKNIFILRDKEKERERGGREGGRDRESIHLLFNYFFPLQYLTALWIHL